MPGAKSLTGSREPGEAEIGNGVALEPEVKASLATLIAHLLLHEVDAPALEILRQEDVLEILEKLETGCREYLNKEWGPEDFDAAAVEYCRLFVLPKGVSPYASAWLGGDPLVAGPRIAARIDEMMLALGLESGHGNPPSDHLGLLLTLAARAWQAGPEGEPLALAVADELLHPWLLAFSQALTQKSNNPLYRAVGSLLSQLSPSLI